MAGQAVAECLPHGLRGSRRRRSRRRRAAWRAMRCSTSRAFASPRAARIMCAQRSRPGMPRAPCTALGHSPRPGCRGRGLHQRHGRARRGFRRQLSRARRCMPSAVVLPAVLAAAERYGLSGADLLARLRRRHRADVPARARGADRDPPRGLPSDRGDRRARRCRRGRRLPPAVAAAADRCARHRRQHGVRHHRISRRGHLDQADARRLGGPGGPARGPARARGLFRARARCWRASTASSMPSALPASRPTSVS